MTHYDTLEVSPTASPEVIRAAYKSLMQRHHPDKNPDKTPANAATAGRAALLAQAYGVLSDPEQRSAYDLRMRTQTMPAHPSRVPTQAPPENRTAPRQQRAPAARDNSSWLVWLLILIVVLCGWLILSLSKKPTAPTAPQFSGSQKPSGDAAPAASDGKPAATPKSTTVLLTTDLTVRLTGGDPQVNRTLLIPAVRLQIGPTDAAQVSQYIAQRRDAITAQLADELALASYQELIKADGESYLRGLMLASVQHITGTPTPPGTPPAPNDLRSSYGVTAVVLPDSFSLK